MVKYNSFMGTVSNETTTTTPTNVVDKEALERALTAPPANQPREVWTGGKAE